MAYQFIPYQQSASFKWKWPLEIGVIDQTDQQREFIIDNQWSHKFCHIHNINDTKQAFNIIYHEGDLTDIYQAISKDNAFASLVILRVEESFFLDSFDENEVKRKLKFIAIIAKAHAVLVITFSFSVNDWLNLFTVELCHNKTIRASLEKTCSHVFGLYNDELDQKATLSYIFEKVINILRLNVEKYPKKYIFKSHFILQDPITIDDLQDLLVDRKQRAQYNHESDEATGLAEIIKSINENTGMNILDEQEIMQYAKPPISSIPLDRGGKPPKNSIPPPFDYGVGGTEIKKDDSFWMKVKDVFKLKGRGTSVPGPDKPKPIPVKIEPRYLQSFFRDTSNENIESLFVSTPYKVIVQIGEFNRKLTQDTNHPIPTDKIFTDPKSDKETIQIQFHSNLSKTIQSSNITLSRIGDSDEAEFNIVTSDHAMMFEAEIYAYHKNRLIQKAILTAHILEANANPDKFPSPQLSIDLKLVSDLENLNQHQPFYTSIGGQLSNKIDEPIPGISNQSPLDLNFSSALQTLMLTIKNRIQQAA
ncbi:MAG TPA: hypothetical protein PLU17_13430, partial [Chitinophagaceae bacterium]|nr:hypothetical protein [Chitinophagaceae bacterium]